MLIDVLKHSAPGFVYSVGMAPALAAASEASLRIMREEAWRITQLQENALAFRDGARARGFDVGLSGGLGIVPIILGSSVKAGQISARLFEAGVNVQPILFPVVPEGSARLRFFMSSEHTAQDIAITLSALSAACR